MRKLEANEKLFSVNEWRYFPEWDTFELHRADKRVAWITKRPHYCDRGHYHVNVDMAGIDGQDGFPRYYMNLDCAMYETTTFLNWRIYKRGLQLENLLIEEAIKNR